MWKPWSSLIRRFHISFHDRRKRYNNGHPGEAEAIALAAERKADLLIMDEKAGRVKAAALNLPFTGLGGILIRAKKIALIPNVKTTLEEIRNKTGFFLTPAALRIILVAADEG